MSQQNEIKERLAQQYNVPAWTIGFSLDRKTAEENGRLIHSEFITHLKQEMHFYLQQTDEN